VENCRLPLLEVNQSVPPLWGLLIFLMPPTACAVGCILPPLRGFHCARLATVLDNSALEKLFHSSFFPNVHTTLTEKSGN